MTFRPVRLTLILVLFAGFLLSFFCTACSSQVYSGKIDSVIFGDINTDSSLFIYIAEDQKFFKQNGIDLTIKSYSTGPQVVTSLNAGEINLGSFGEYVVVGQAFARTKAKVVATIDKFQAFFLVGRQDLGIQKIADISGKKVGLVQSALPEFYFGRYMLLNGIDKNSVKVVNVNPDQWVDSITGGSVDAIVVNQFYLSKIQEQLSGKIVVLPIQNNQAGLSVLSCDGDWLKANPDVAKRFLKAISEADQFLVSQPAEAKAIWQKRFNYTTAYFNTLVREHQFSLVLDQSLIMAMEDEARWMISNNLTAEKQVPNFNDYIDETALKAIKPDAVKIIR